MLVSILIPTRNRREMLAEALASAQAQSYQNVEIVVSDDGSNDGTRELVLERGKQDPRIRLLCDNPRPGIFENMAHLIEAAAGEACVLLADDDRLGPDFVERLLAPMIDNSEMAVVFCEHRAIDRQGSFLPGLTRLYSERSGRSILGEGIVKDPLRAALNQSICIGFALFRISALRRVPFDLDCDGAADWDCALRIVGVGSAFFVKEFLGDYRYHDSSATRSRTVGTAGIVHCLSKHQFQDPALETQRMHLLGLSLRDHAVRLLIADSEAALVALARYRTVGGRIWDGRYLFSLLAVSGPRPIRTIARAILRRRFQKRRH